jgi:hypothetical protein
LWDIPVIIGQQFNLGFRQKPTVAHRVRYVPEQKSVLRNVRFGMADDGWPYMTADEIDLFGSACTLTL